MNVTKEMAVTRLDDPRRCGANNGKNQCTRLCEDGFEYCAYHNSGQRTALKRSQQRNYLLTRWKAEIDHYANNGQVKSLREEIGILRLLMQTTLEKCEDVEDLQIHAPRIIDLTQRIERVVDTCHRLEEKTGFLVDKNQIIMLAEQILIIFSEYVPDADILAKVADRIQQAIETKTVTVVDHGTISQSRPL